MIQYEQGLLATRFGGEYSLASGEPAWWDDFAMRISPFLRRWFSPVCFAVVGFLAGYVVFHPGWSHAPPLTDGSAVAFEKAARLISEDDLLAKASPKERVAWLLEICKQPSSLRRDHELYEAVQKMQPGDFLAAMADLQALGKHLASMDEGTRQGLIRASMERWLDVDEEGALRWLAATRAVVDSGMLKLQPMGFRDLGEMYAVLASRKPDWTFEQALKMGKVTQRDTGIAVALRECATTNPKKAREWLKTLEGTPDWKTAYKACVEGIAAADPSAALDMALAGGEETRDEYAQIALSEGAARTPSRLPEMLQKLEPGKRGPLVWTLLFGMSNQPNFDAIGFFAEQLASNPDIASPANLRISGGFYTLMARDPLRTVEALNVLPDTERAGLMSIALRDWSYLNPASMLDWLTSHPLDAPPKEISVFANSASHIPERFAQWVSTLPEGTVRSSAQLAMANALLARGSVAEALQAFPASQDERAASSFAEAIAARDLTAAGQWVAALPEGAARSGAVQGLVKTWATQAPRDAAQWIENLPPGGARDAGARAFAAATVASDPAAATLWVDQIQDSRMREAATLKVFPVFAAADRRAARAWLQGLSGVSDATKARILAFRR